MQIYLDKGNIVNGLCKLKFSKKKHNIEDKDDGQIK